MYDGEKHWKVPHNSTRVPLGTVVTPERILTAEISTKERATWESVISRGLGNPTLYNVSDKTDGHSCKLIPRLPAAQLRSGFYTSPNLPRHQYRSFTSSARGTNMIFRVSASRCRSISLSRNAQSIPILSLVKTLNSSWLPGVLLYTEYRHQSLYKIIAGWREPAAHL